MRVPERVLTTLLLLIFLSGSVTAISPTVEKGVLDLSEIEQGDEFFVRLNGEWEFYFGTFIYGTPGAVCDTLIPDCYVRVPGFWYNSTIDGRKLPRQGYGTYRALILLPRGYRDRLGFDVPVFNTAYELSINGVTMARNGTPARSRAESVPSYNPLFFSYAPRSDTLELLIRVSNHEHRGGGFWMPMKAGTFNSIQNGYTNQWLLSSLVSGFLLASFIILLVFYLYDRDDRKLLLFAILTLCIVLRTFLSAPFYATIFDLRNWSLIIRVEYTVLLLMISSGMWLGYYLYPTRWFRKVALASNIIFTPILAAIFFLPVRIFTWSIFVMHACAVLIMLYVVSMSIRSIIKGDRRNILFLLAFMAILFGVVSDILLSNALKGNQQLYILLFMVLLYVLIQAILLIADWVKRGKEREKLALQLEELNRHLESRVEERTRELTDRTKELNTRNQQIAKQNKKLTETISLKNKVFSVIAHDLRSPLVNILYTLYLLKEDEFRDRTESLADSCIQYSQQLISLLENMLVWGRDQEDMIKYTPADNDLTDIILTNISILKDSADRKNIELNFTQVGRSNGWFDRDLVDIIIRNLLSNAIKYSYHGGKVTVHVKEKEESSEWVTISICDNGVGITPERQKRLFTGHEIDSTPGTDSEKGTGIGLKLVYELVALSKGTITVESTPGSGTCFTVILPGSAQAFRIR